MGNYFSKPREFVNSTNSKEAINNKKESARGEGADNVSFRQLPVSDNTGKHTPKCNFHVEDTEKSHTVSQRLVNLKVANTSQHSANVDQHPSNQAIDSHITELETLGNEHCDKDVSLIKETFPMNSSADTKLKETVQSVENKDLKDTVRNVENKDFNDKFICLQEGTVEKAIKKAKKHYTHNKETRKVLGEGLTAELKNTEKLSDILFHANSSTSVMKPKSEGASGNSSSQTIRYSDLPAAMNQTRNKYTSSTSGPNHSFPMRNCADISAKGQKNVTQATRRSLLKQELNVSVPNDIRKLRHRAVAQVSSVSPSKELSGGKTANVRDQKRRKRKCPRISHLEEVPCGSDTSIAKRLKHDCVSCSSSVKSAVLASDLKKYGHLVKPCSVVLEKLRIP